MLVFRNFYLPLLFLILPLLFSCNDAATEAPEETSLDSTLNVPESVLHIPVNYRVSGIEDLINARLGKKLFDNWIPADQRGDSIQLAITKNGRIEVSRSGKTLIYSVPLYIKAGYSAKVAGFRIRNQAPLTTSVIVQLASDVALDPKWNIDTKTRLLKIDWVEEPYLNVSGFKINLRPVLEKVIAEKQNLITSRIDESLGNNLNTRPIVQKLWNDIQKPVRINHKIKDIWLQAKCSDITGKLLETDPDLISLQFQVRATIQTLLKKDLQDLTVKKLPDFRMTKNGSDSLHIFVHSAVDFDLINDLVNAELKGRKITQQGFEVIIQKVRMYGTPKGVAVEMKVKGDMDGALYAEGRLQFDSLSKVVAVRDLDFHIDTRNVLAHSADWMLHSDILTTIASKLVFNTAVLSDKIPELIMHGIERGKTGSKIDVEVSPLEVRPYHLLVTKKNIQLITKAEGKAAVTLEKSVFRKKR